VATRVNIDGELYKLRSPTGTWLLTLVTVLVYWFVWYYKINHEARRYLRDQSIKPWAAVLAIFPGLLLLLVPLPHTATDGPGRLAHSYGFEGR
jgi:O-antigen/teichoic acid export membrane protein